MPGKRHDSCRCKKCFDAVKGQRPVVWRDIIALFQIGEAILLHCRRCGHQYKSYSSAAYRLNLHGNPTEDEVIEYLKAKFPEDTLCEMVDAEAMEWLDDDWADEYDEALEWYANCGGGEAEAAVSTVVANALYLRFGVPFEDTHLFIMSDLLECVTDVINWR